MALFVDSPAWPAHGTRFAHLVSDSDLGELHDFARALGLPVRAFELDHYDLPERLWQRAVDAGARPVTRRGILAALVSGGLRVPGAERSAALRRQRDADLARRWHRLGARVEASGAAWAALGDELLHRWAEPHRSYHARGHLADILDRLDRLTGDRPGEDVAAGPAALRHEESRDGGVPPAVALAAWFHDAVHTGQTPADEIASAELAAARLAGFAPTTPLVEEVAAYVRVTAGHLDQQAPSSAPPGRAALLCDADLGILGTGPRRYRAYAAGVRAEYRHVDDQRFASGRAAVLRTLLGRPRLYVTPEAHAWWEEPARANIRAEIAQLTGQP